MPSSGPSLMALRDTTSLPYCQETGWRVGRGGRESCMLCPRQTTDMYFQVLGLALGSLELGDNSKKW